MYSNIDLVIFSSFLIINLLVGLVYSKNIKNINEYALGDRNFSTATIVATLVATWSGAGFFSFTLVETYRQGIYFLIPALADSLVLVIIGSIFIPRMGEFIGKLSVAEAMGDLFGKKVRLITTICSILASIGVLGVQFKVSAKILELIFGASGFYATVLSAVIVILYSTFGGIKAVTFTDIIQFFTFGCIIPIIATVVWDALHDHTLIAETLQTSPLFDYKAAFDLSNPKFYKMLVLLGFFLIPEFSPIIFQRISIAKNTMQAARSFKIAGFFCFLVQVIIALIGIFILSDNPNLRADDLLSYIINHYAYTGFKGIIAVGVMAMIMSTADSLINSISVIFAHDLCRPLGFKWSENELLVSKVFACISGICAIFFALKLKSILELIVMAWSFYIPIISTPFLLAIFGFRSSEKSVLIGMLAGAATVIIWEYGFTHTGIESFVPGMFSNAAFLFGSHYLLRQPGGWVGVGDKKTLLAFRQERTRKRQNFINSILNFNLSEFFKQNIPQDSSIYCYIGFFSSISVLMSIYTMPKNVTGSHANIIRFVYQSTFILSCYFLMYPIWSKYLKDKVWGFMICFIGTFYILVLTPSLSVIISDFSQTQLMLFFLNIIAVAIIFRWHIGLLMILTGVLISIFMLGYHIDIEHIRIGTFGVQIKVTYCMLLLSSILIAFMKPAQQMADKKIKLLLEAEKQIGKMSEQILNLIIIKQEFINSINNEIEDSIKRINTSLLKDKDNSIHSSEDERKNYIDTISREYYHLKEKINNISDLSNLGADKVSLVYKNVDFEELVQKALDECYELYLENGDIQFSLNLEASDVHVVCDEDKMMEAVKHLIKNAINCTKKGLIEITLSNAELTLGGQQIEGIKFSIVDEGLAISESELEYIFTPFVRSSIDKNEMEENGLGLSICERIIKIHHGVIIAENNLGKSGCKFEFTIPL